MVQADKAECEKREAEVWKRWSRFLPGYCNAREVLEYCQNPTEVEEVIQGEKNRLEAHLKTNSGLMVPYSPSEQYAAFADKHLVKRSYLKILIEERVQFLEKAIAYVNKDYRKHQPTQLPSTRWSARDGPGRRGRGWRPSGGSSSATWRSPSRCSSWSRCGSCSRCCGDRNKRGALKIIK